MKSARKRFIALRPAPVAALGRGFRLRLALWAALAGSVRFADAIGRQASCRKNTPVPGVHAAGND